MRFTLALLVPLLLSACAPARAWQVQKPVIGGMLYTVAVVDLKQQQLSLHWRNPTTRQPYGSFSQLAARLKKEGQPLLFATNSGIYAAGLRPLGLHIEKGQPLVGLNNARKGNDNFSMLPNGVFWVRGEQAGVTETQAYERLVIRPEYATQSGPLLLANGKIHPDFNKNSTSFKVRSGVGVCKDGKVRFVISSGPVNFYAFALAFRDALGCPDALYLDGSISAYATPETNTQFTQFAGIWAVTSKTIR